jgi:hypothetical protein
MSAMSWPCFGGIAGTLSYTHALLHTRPANPALQVHCAEVPGNPGRLHISREEILRFAACSDFHGEHHALLSRIVFRGTLLLLAAGGMMSLLADPTWLRWSVIVEEQFRL